VDELCDAVEERASILLTGDPGVGKACVLRALRTRLPEAGFRLTLGIPTIPREPVEGRFPAPERRSATPPPHPRGE
jgi:GTPase SAR1 family protein